MNNQILKNLSRATALSILLMSGSGAFAQSKQVALTSLDGDSSISGELVKFEDGFLTINTEVGQLRVLASKMTCVGLGCPVIEVSPDTVVFAGSDTVGLGLLPLLAAGFADAKSGEADITNGSTDEQVIVKIIGDDGFGDELVTLDVTSTSSSTAFKALLDRSANIGMASRQISTNEINDLRRAGAGNMLSAESEHVVAVDSLVVIVNQNNPVKNLTLGQLADIYSGRVTNWIELGGTNLPIRPLTRPAGSGTRSVFETTVFAGRQTNLSANIPEIKTNNEVSAMVNSDEQAVGFVGFAFTRGAKALSLTNECGLTVSPSTFSAKTEEYPLARRLYLYNRADNLPAMGQEFLNYSMSEGADPLIAKSGFISLSVEAVSQDFSGNRMQEIVRNTSNELELNAMRELLVEMLQWQRLSTTVRFGTGSSLLDNKASRDIDRLISFLETQPQGTEVAVVGFSDSDGEFEANRALSFQRSQQAADVILRRAGGRLGNIVFVSKGFGELSPTACNTSLKGKGINRRVELWMRAPT